MADMPSQPYYQDLNSGVSLHRTLSSPHGRLAFIFKHHTHIHTHTLLSLFVVFSVILLPFSVKKHFVIRLHQDQLNKHNKDIF